MSPHDSTDKRDPLARQQLITKFRRELQEVPGLALTIAQMARLFDIPTDVCGRLVNTLVADGVMSTRPDGRFTGVFNSRMPDDTFHPADRVPPDATLGS